MTVSVPASPEHSAGPPPTPRRRFATVEAPRRVGRGYSRYVRWMKLLLPTAAGIVMVLVLAWAKLDPTEMLMRAGQLRIRPEDAYNLVVRNPRYIGTDKEDRPFTVTAEAASQRSPGTMVIDLRNPKADVTLADGTWIAANAAQGNYDREARRLELSGGVNLYEDKGYELHADHATVDMASGSAGSDAETSGQGPLGHLVGSGFRVENRGAVIKLQGPAKVIVRPEAISAVDGRLPGVLIGPDGNRVPVQDAPKADAPDAEAPGAEPPKPLPVPAPPAAEPAEGRQGSAGAVHPGRLATAAPEGAAKAHAAPKAPAGGKPAAHKPAGHHAPSHKPARKGASPHGPAKSEAAKHRAAKRKPTAKRAAAAKPKPAKPAKAAAR